MTLKANDSVKVLTVRGTNFEAATSGSATAPIEKAPEGDFKTDLSEFVSQELTKSERPELTAAGVIISGGNEDIKVCILKCNIKNLINFRKRIEVRG